MTPGTRVIITISPECRTHYAAYGDLIDRVQGVSAEVVPPDDVHPSVPLDPAHDIPVLWGRLPGVPGAGGWFARAELEE